MTASVSVTEVLAGLLLLGLVWLIAAPRLAKPNSPWAKRFYGSEKLERSRPDMKRRGR